VNSEQVANMQTWQILIGLISLLVTFGTIVWRLSAVIATQGAKHKELEAKHEAHEDICEERYKGISADAAHDRKTSDERHRETREWQAKIEGKLDAMLQSRRASDA
jgi:hypothetical protein